MKLFLVIAASALVATPATSNHLSLNNFVDLALQNNVEIKINREMANVRRHNVDAASAFPDPHISYGLAPMTIGNDPGTRHTVTIKQNIPWPGTVSTRELIASARHVQALANSANTRLEKIAAARTLWAEWWYVHRAISINRENAVLLRKLASVVKSRYAAGVGLQQDALDVRTRQTHNDHDLVLLQKKKATIAARMRRLLADQSMVLGQPHALPSLPIVNEHAATIDSTNSPMLAAARAKRSETSAQVRLSEKAYYPDLGFSVSYLGALDPHEKRLQVGVSIKLPFGGGRDGKLGAAMAAQRSSELQELDTQYWLAEQTGKTLANITAARDTIRIYETQLITQLRRTLRAAKSDYASGVGKFSDVINVDERLRKARFELARARTNEVIGSANLSFLTGGVIWPVPVESLESAP